MSGSRIFDGSGGYIGFGGAMTKPTAVSGLTWGAWINPTGYGESSLGRVLVFDSTHGLLVSSPGGEQTLRGTIGFATTVADRRAETGFIPLNAWRFVAMTWDGGSPASSIRLYRGLPGGIPTEATAYTDITNGAGALNAFGDFIVGNRTAQDRTFAGRIARAFYVNRVLTLAELALAMYLPPVVQPLVFPPLLGFATEPDLGGGRHNGAITGNVTTGDGPPLGPWSPPHRMGAVYAAEPTASIFRADVFPYDTALGVATSFPYDTLLGVPLQLKWDALAGVKVPLQLLYDVLGGRVEAESRFLYDVFARPEKADRFLWDVKTTAPVWTPGPIKRRSEVKP